MNVARALRLPLLAIAAPALAACGNPFDPASLVESVRLLAISADKPYAAAGETVGMDALAFDGRPSVTPVTPEKLVSWVPFVCPDLPYFGCYLALGTGAAGAIEPGVDLTSVLTQGTHFSFSMPEVVKPPATYGTVVVFAIACAGHVQYVIRNQDTVPPAPPLGCFDDTGTELGPDASVFAYAQVFSFADGRTNQDPVISNLTQAGAVVDPVKGIPLQHCPATGKCPTVALDTFIPSSSWELDPGDLDAAGKPIHEEIWVDYYVTAGAVATSALLYDATLGALTSPSVQLTPPAAAGEQVLWAVAHDNRGGVSWLQVPLHVQ